MDSVSRPDRITGPMLVASTRWSVVDTSSPPSVVGGSRSNMESVSASLSGDDGGSVPGGSKLNGWSLKLVGSSLNPDCSSLKLVLVVGNTVLPSPYNKLYSTA